jgi:hypothetical protein
VLGLRATAREQDQRHYVANAGEDVGVVESSGWLNFPEEPAAPDSESVKLGRHVDPVHEKSKPACPCKESPIERPWGKLPQFG